MSAGVRCRRCPDVRQAETCGGKMFEMMGRGWVWKFGLGLAVRGKIREPCLRALPTYSSYATQLTDEPRCQEREVFLPPRKMARRERTSMEPADEVDNADLKKDEDPVQRVHSPLEARTHDTVAVGDQRKARSMNDDKDRARTHVFLNCALGSACFLVCCPSREDAKETENSPADEIDGTKTTLNAASQATDD
ncbi:hypothetical protein M405DRAFT_895812 [Rhizopogon salebrosus TDB-379]|nr:hypothetical protein M405DRAFT_895812 [Rhizopogon salebrosus TDB-379]